MDALSLLVGAGIAHAAFCRADWRRLLQGEYDKFEPAFEAVAGVVTDSYPGPDGAVRYDVRQHGKIWLGMHQDGSPDTADSPWLRLAREDVMVWRLNAEGRILANKMAEKNETGDCEKAYYLFVSSDDKNARKPSEVFYRVDHGEPLANSLCKMFANENAGKKNCSIFYYAAASRMPVEEQVILDVAIQGLEGYDDPDPGLYDPPPPRWLMMRAQYALCARGWEKRLLQKAVSSERLDGQQSVEKRDVPPSPGGAPAEKCHYYVVNNLFRIEGDFSKVTTLKGRVPVWGLQPFTQMVMKVLVTECRKYGMSSDEIYRRAKKAFEAEHSEITDVIPKCASLIHFFKLQRDKIKKTHPLYEQLNIVGRKPAMYSWRSPVVEQDEKAE